MATLTIALRNTTTSANVFAYITGQAIDNGNALFLLSADARTPYFPTSPSAPGASLARDCAIRLGAPGNTVNATIPHIAGGRIWFSIDQPLTFRLNPGPGLVEPAVTNPSDPNININWGFCEFTWNSSQMFANISYVDFVSIPIALTLTNTAGRTQTVAGMPRSGLDTVCSGLQAQQSRDNAGWGNLIVRTPSGRNLRALSPNNGITINPNLFQNYYNPHTDAVWRKYTSTPLTIDTQAQWGRLTGTIKDNVLDFGSDNQTRLTFGKPSAKDIFSCSTGPFTPSPSILKGALIARLSAAFNRSTLLKAEIVPAGDVQSFYTEPITNHYSRIVHTVNAEGRGYAFPFDDVSATGQGDLSGAVFDGSPRVLGVEVGGGGIGAGARGGMVVQE
ncbi:MAG: hypothetical protein Q9164_005276 [Protoblastenia rupestris]